MSTSSSLMDVAGGGAMDERRPLCSNMQQYEGGADASRQRASLQPHRIAGQRRARAVPSPRSRVTVGSDREVSYHADSRIPAYINTHGKDHALTSSLELSQSSEFISIEGSDVTSEALVLCEKWALKNYRRVLVALGWIPIQGECLGRNTRRALHVLLILFWTVVILGAFIAQILSCFRRDKFLAFHDAKTWRLYNESCQELEDDSHPSHAPISNGAVLEAKCQTLYCDNHHIFSDYILFDLLLLTVYLYGVYLFRSEEGGDLSYLHNLASRAFVMNSVSSQVATKRNSNWRLLLNIMLFCISGFLWIIASLVVRILTIISANLMKAGVAIEWKTEIFCEEEKVILMTFSLIGFFFFDMVYMASALNHAVQSELLVWLISSVTTLLQKNEYPNIDAAIKDITECRRYLRTLNGRAATSVALIMFIVGNMSVLAVLTVNRMTDYDDDKFKATVAVLNIIVWFSLVSLPIIQATRVTRVCYLLKDAVAEIRSRPQLYANTPQLDLDSLLLLTQTIRLRATLFGVPMSPALVYGAIALTAFIAVLLSQTDKFSFSSI